LRQSKLERESKRILKRVISKEYEKYLIACLKNREEAKTPDIFTKEWIKRETGK
jgi:hypothetical protein